MTSVIALFAAPAAVRDGEPASRRCSGSQRCSCRRKPGGTCSRRSAASWWVSPRQCSSLRSRAPAPSRDRSPLVALTQSSPRRRDRISLACNRPLPHACPRRHRDRAAEPMDGGPRREHPRYAPPSRDDGSPSQHLASPVPAGSSLVHAMGAVTAMPGPSLLCRARRQSPAVSVVRPVSRCHAASDGLIWPRDG